MKFQLNETVVECLWEMVKYEYKKYLLSPDRSTFDATIRSVLVLTETIEKLKKTKKVVNKEV